MNSLELASTIAEQMKAMGIPMEEILKWFRSYRPPTIGIENPDAFALFYQDNGDWRWYCNAPDFRTVLTDMLSEIPPSMDIFNTKPNRFYVRDNKGEYGRNWWIFPLDG